MMFIDDIYLREDASHNIYQYNTNDNTEYFYVPGSPTLNRTWATSSSGSREVTNLSASVTTSGCSYTGLLEITSYSGSTPQYTFYYKKGLGLVAQLGSSSEFKLTAVTLK